MGLPYIIAELGVNFYDTARKESISPIEAAKKYVLEAAHAGASAVKFQSYKADTIVSKNSPAYWDLSKEPTTTQYELFKKHDGFNCEDYQTLCCFCRTQGVDFLSTPFDFESADYLEPMLDAYKISSSDLSNIPLLRHIARKGKKIYLSTGASYISEIEKAVRIIAEEGCGDICIMHCILSYPTRIEDANLNMITHLNNIFPEFEIGYSDHTMPDKSMIVLAAAHILGAQVIEKHFTLDKTLPGNDHYHSMDSSDLAQAVKNFQILDAAGGSSYKTVLECEAVPRREARRSIVITRDMKKGEIVRKEDIMFKRPGIGISPEFEKIVIGRKVTMDISEDTTLLWEMI